MLARALPVSDARRLVLAQDWCDAEVQDAITRAADDVTAVVQALRAMPLPEGAVAEIEGLLHLQERVRGVQLERVLAPTAPGTLPLVLGRMGAGGVSVIVAAAVAPSAALIQRFHREQGLLRGLAHPCVAPLLAGGDQDGLGWAAFAAPAGRPLSRRLGQRLSEADAFCIIRQLVAGAAALTAAGLHHRVLTPDHLWVDQIGDSLPEAQLVDLGLVRALAGTTSEIAAMAAAYAAPEHLRGERGDERSMVFACAAILAHLLAGSSAFPSRVVTAGRTGVVALAEQPPLLPYQRGIRLTPAIDELLGRALRLDPDDRPSSLGAFQRDCEDILHQLGQAQGMPSARRLEQDRTPLTTTAIVLPETPTGGDITRRILRKHAELRAAGLLRAAPAPPPVVSPLIEPFERRTTPRPTEVLALVEAHGWTMGETQAQLRALLEQGRREGALLPADICQRLEACGALTRDQAATLEAALDDQATIPRLRLRSRLSQVEDGRWYLAQDVEGKPALVSVHRIGAQERRARFAAELPATIALRHPRLVAVLDGGCAADHCWIAQQVVAGPSVAEVLAPARVAPEAWSLRILRQVAEALIHLHATTDRPHLCIHPGAIRLVREEAEQRLFPPGEQALLGDCGQGALAPWRASATPYMAPEVVAGGDGDARSDVYAVGAVLYRLLNGSLPTAGVVEDRQDWHPLIRTVLRGTLQRDPDARFADGLVLHAALAAAARELSQSYLAEPQIIDRRVPGETTRLLRRVTSTHSAREGPSSGSR